MTKKKLVFSLVLYGKDYIDTFKKYTFKTLKDSFSLIDKNQYQTILFLSCYEKEKNYILNNINLFDEIVIFDLKTIKEDNRYSILSTHQRLHNIKAKTSKYDYMFFLYADFLLTKNVIKNSLEKIDHYKSIFTFALLLNSNNQKFDVFINSLRENENFIEKLIEYDLIDDYHKSFEINAFNINKSFIYNISEKSIYLKAFHMHPVVINLNKIDLKYLNLHFYTLDNGFLNRLKLAKDDIYVEEDLNKICIFSYDHISRLKRMESELVLDKNSFEYIERGFFYLNYNLNSNIECWLFDNFTLTNIIQNKSNNRLNKLYKSKNKNKKKFYKLREIISQGRQYIKQSNLFDTRQLNYFFVFFYVILFSIMILLPKSKILYSTYIYLRNTLLKSVKKGYLTRTNNLNIIYSIFTSKTIYTYFNLYLNGLKNSILDTFKFKNEK